MKKLAATVVLVTLGLLACDKSGATSDPATSSSSSTNATPPASGAAPASSAKAGSGW